MSDLYDVLELCLQEVENGADPEAILSRHPEHAEELRPILTASVHARKRAVPTPAAEVVRRNRARLLQRAAQMHREKPKPFISLPQRWAVSLVLLLVFLFGGTGIVRASSNSLPGDNLYSVKRSWERMVLLLTFDKMERETLEIEHENERLKEMDELFVSGRTAKVDFAGIVTRENGAGWWISNILVIVSDQTVLPDRSVEVGTAVRVYGVTRGAGMVIAERLELLPSGAPLPDVEDDEELEAEAEETPAAPNPGISGPGSGSGTEAPEEEDGTPSPAAAPKIESFTDALLSMNQKIWLIGNTRVNVADAEIKGVPVIGALAKAEGYVGADGIFVALKIEIFTINSNDNSNANANSNDDDNDSNTGANTNDDNSDANTNDNDNDNSSNDDNSGSGGNDNNGNGND